MNSLQVEWRFYKLSCPRIKCLVYRNRAIVLSVRDAAERCRADLEMTSYTVNKERRKWETKKTDLAGSLERDEEQDLKGYCKVIMTSIVTFLSVYKNMRE